MGRVFKLGPQSSITFDKYVNSSEHMR
jgi:hypothetical protein